MGICVYVGAASNRSWILAAVVSVSLECVEVGVSNGHVELGGGDRNLEFKRTCTQRRSRRCSFWLTRGFES